MLVGKSRGGTPFCRTLKIGFPKSRIFCKAFPLQLFHRNSCKIVTCCFWETRRGGLVRPASKSCRFSHHPLRVPKAWHRDFAACGQRSGLLALNLASIFEKLLDQKTFRLPAACFRKTTYVWFGKAGAHPQLALGIAIAPETLSHIYNSLILKGNCDSFDALLDFCLISLCSSVICFANVGCSPTPRQHF